MDTDKTDQGAFRVAYLIAGFVQQNLSDSEETELDAWVGANMNNQRLFEELTNPAELDKWNKWKEKLPAAETLARLQKKLKYSNTPKLKSALHFMWGYVAAAVIVAVAIVALKWIPENNKSFHTVPAIAMDIPPGTHRATLILSDGRKILLDTAVKGNVAIQGNTNIDKNENSVISYHIAKPTFTPDPEIWNTIITPAGGTFSLLLADGSKVVLNANSSLRFPTAFTAKKRSVILSGEGYFEVAKDPVFPFEVVAAGNKITVLGTHFNINSYEDEPFSKVTLEEGSVRLNNLRILKPGEQAQIRGGSAITVIQADLEKELAWKNGLFLFRQTQLDEVMRQVGRWYNCEVKFEANITDHFNASVGRNLPVSNLLGFLEGTGRVHFKIEDKKIIVLQ